MAVVQDQTSEVASKKLFSSNSFTLFNFSKMFKKKVKDEKENQEPKAEEKIKSETTEPKIKNFEIDRGLFELYLFSQNY